MSDTSANENATEAEPLGGPDGDITVETIGPIMQIGIRRPAKLNGFTPQMLRQLRDAFGLLESTPEVRVGVVFGHGDHFTAGLDLPRFAEAMQRGDSETSGQRIDPFNLGRGCTKPIVTAVQGITFTAGIELMLGTDIVVAADDCRFSQLEPKRGIMATGGATFRFVERGGYGNAMYHLLIMDEFDAAEAHRVGLVQEVVPAGTQLARAMELAGKIAELAPLAVQATKASAQRYLEHGQRSAIDDLTPTQAKLAASADAAEGVQSFIERRPPVFTGE